MLGNAQTIDNRRAVSLRIHDGCFSQIIRIDVTDFCHLLRCIFLYDLFDLLIALGTLCDKFVILQAFLNDHMHDAVRKGYVGTRL